VATALVLATWLLVSSSTGFDNTRFCSSARRLPEGVLLLLAAAGAFAVLLLLLVGAAAAFAVLLLLLLVLLPGLSSSILGCTRPSCTSTSCMISGVLPFKFDSQHPSSDWHTLLLPLNPASSCCCRIWQALAVLPPLHWQLWRAAMQVWSLFKMSLLAGLMHCCCMFSMAASARKQPCWPLANAGSQTQ
jgi:hypothetical protein